jgi:hypothetical protein
MRATKSSLNILIPSWIIEYISWDTPSCKQ